MLFQSFDPSLKKKKKKKKTPFDLDGALNEAEGDNETPEPAKDENLDDLDLENFGKKKKKKKKAGEGDEEKGDKEKDESEDIDLESFGKKKKPKKKKNINLDELKEALDDDNKENGTFLFKMGFDFTLFEIFIFLSKNSTLISRENCRFYLGEKLVKMLWFWTF